MKALEECIAARKKALDASSAYHQFVWKADLVDSWISK